MISKKQARILIKNFEKQIQFVENFRLKFRKAINRYQEEILICKKCKQQKQQDERVKAGLSCGDCDYNLKGREAYCGY